LGKDTELSLNSHANLPDASTNLEQKDLVVDLHLHPPSQPPDPKQNLDEAFGDIAARDDGSSSSSDASSNMIEERAHFVAAQRSCANILIFNRKGLPNDTFIRATKSSVNREPIVIDRALVQHSAIVAPSTTSTGLEIIPWQPLRHELALQLWQVIVESHRQAKSIAAPSLVIILLDIQCEQGPSESSPVDFKFQTSPIRPIPVEGG